MATFLTTKAVASSIENIITAARSEIIIVSPYLQISAQFLLRLEEAAERGVQISIVYRNDDISWEEEYRINHIPVVKLYDCRTIHAKCYLNEESVVLTSMNLYETSEYNNFEMGILFSRTSDGGTYAAVRAEVETILRASYRVNPLQKKGEAALGSRDTELPQPILSFFETLAQRLKAQYPGFHFDCSLSKIQCEKFLSQHLLLIIEHRGKNLRCDFRLSADWKKRNELYEILWDDATKLTKEISHPINWGNQMKRLKLDFQDFSYEDTDQGVGKVIELVGQAGRSIAERIDRDQFIEFSS